MHSVLSSGLRVVQKWRRDASAMYFSAFAAILCCLMVPLVDGPRWNTTVLIEATGEKNSVATSTNVWVVRGERLGIWPMILEEAQRLQMSGDGIGFVVIDPSRASGITLSGRFSSDASFYLYQSPFSGIARVTIGESTRIVDLYSPVEGRVEIRLSDTLPPFGWKEFGDAAVYSLVAFVLTNIGFMVVFAGLSVMPYRSMGNVDVPWWLFRALAAPLILTGSAALLADWPGLMSPDSLDQWRQAKLFSFGDWHPPAYALTMYLTQQIADTPGLLAVAQIVSWSGMFAACLVELRRQGAPLWLLATASVAHATYPPIPFHAIALWKDIPYTIGFLAIIYALLVARRVGIVNFIREPLALASLATGSLVMLLLRHNGLMVVLTTYVSLLWLARVQGKSSNLAPFRFMLASGLLTVATFIIITRVAYPAIGVKKDNTEYLAAASPLFAIAGIAHFGGSVPGDIAALVDTIMPPKVVQERYDCQTFVPIMFDPSMKTELARGKAAALFAYSLRAAVTQPVPFLRHVRCFTAFYFQIQSTTATFWSPIPREIEAGPLSTQLDLRSASANPRLRALADHVLTFTNQPAWQWLFWRPALQILAGALLFLVMLRRRANPVVVVIMVSFSVAILSTVPISISPDYRYMLPVVTLFFLLPAVLYIENIRQKC